METNTANRFSRQEFDGVVPSGTFYNVMAAAKEAGVCTDYEERWGKRGSGRPLRYYDIDEMMEWLQETDRFTKTLRGKFLKRLKELKGE